MKKEKPVKTIRAAAISQSLNRIVIATKETGTCYTAKLDLDSDSLPTVFTKLPERKKKLYSILVWDVALSPDGSKGALVGRHSSRKTLKPLVQLFETTTGADPVVMENLGDRDAQTAMFHPGGEKLAVSLFRDFSINVIDFSTRRLDRKITGHELGIVSFAFSPDGSKLASGSLNRIRTWDWESGRELRSVWAHENLVQALTWLDEHRIVSGGEDGQLKLWLPGEFRPDFLRFEDKNWFRLDSADNQLRWNSDPTKFAPGFIDQSAIPGFAK